MIKPLLFVTLLSLSASSFGQTNNLSFESQLSPGFHEFTKSQVDSFLSRANLDNYRLQDSHVTLIFDNGFTVLLLSANELLHSGIISTSSAYPVSFPEGYKAPIFHMNGQGEILAMYTSENLKSKDR